MHLLLIYPSPGILGGVETLIVRMSRWLVNHGHRVTVLADSPDHWTNLLSKEVRCVPLGRRFPQLYYYYHARRLWRTLGIDRPDVIKTFDIGSSWIGCQLAAIIGNECRLLAGIYNPFVFSWYYSVKGSPFWDAKNVYVKNFVENIPANNRLFCSVEQIEEFENVHRRKGFLWPIPIATDEFDAASRRAKWGKIVSIGRLSPMKEYNLYMIEVVRDLIKRGYDVRWSVYGTGEYEAAMKEAIKKDGLEGAISLEGTIPYKRFRAALEDAYIFVGMGTTILEASLFKVPNVTAAAYDRQGLTWGPVYRIPRGSLGPPGDMKPTLKVTDEIERILRLQPSEYAAEQERVYDHVQVHTMEASMKQFMDLAQRALPIRQPKTLFLANYSYWLMRRASGRRLKEQKHPTGCSLAAS